MPSTSSATKGNSQKSGARRQAGRPAAKTFINVQVKVSTRKALNELKSITGLRTQGDVLDQLIAEVMQRRPR